MALAIPTLPGVQEAIESVKVWAESDARFAGIVAAGTPTTRALARWSMELLRANRTKDALSVLRSALALNPLDTELWTNYGTVLNQENLPNEAAACLEYSVTLLRHQPDAWLMLGLVRKKLGDPAAAETAYCVVLEQEPNSMLAWQFLGLLKQEQQDYAAADCLTACIKAGGSAAALFANLGKLCYQLGRIPEASAAYARATHLEPVNFHYRRMARKSAFLEKVIQGVTIDEAITSFTNSFPPEQRDREKELVDLLSSAFSILSGFGHIEAAARVGSKQLALWPDNPSMEYLLKAVTGDSRLDRSPPEYVVEHFDAFAEGFDEQLVEALGYDIPEKICQAVLELTPVGRLYETLDAGCGTGLCGPMLQSLSRGLTGVDLSPKMLEQARRRAIYDVLFCEDVVLFLPRSRERFDLIVAADLMIYFGDLGPVFSGAAASLKPGGLLALSTELWTGAGFRLKPSGRFAHAQDYVRSKAASEFEELVYIETTIRLEAGERLPGNIFIFRRR